MIVNIDVKSLEIVVAAWLSQDKILCQELLDGVDIHGRNQESFDLPDRLIAKTLVFRILYGGSEHGFIKDSDFTRVSTSKKYWANVIEKFYDKYQGLARWHTGIVQEVGRTGKLTTPFGRSFEYTRKPDGSLPEPAIKNYIVQGTGADIVAIARVSFYKRWMNGNINGVLINTVHDSIVLDIESSWLEAVIKLTNAVFDDLPNNINRVFDVGFNLPIKAEISVGENQSELEEV